MTGQRTVFTVPAEFYAFVYHPVNKLNCSLAMAASCSFPGMTGYGGKVLTGHRLHGTVLGSGKFKTPGAVTRLMAIFKCDS